MLIKHHKYSSTPHFDNLYKELENQAKWAFRFLYGREATQEELPMPIVKFKGSEKLHGTNMGVVLTGNVIHAQGRNRIVEIGKDQDGMAAYVKQHAQAFEELFARIIEDYEVDINTTTIVLDGEWAGGSIQSGNCAISGIEKSFFLFDDFRLVTEDKTLYVSTFSYSNHESRIYRMKDFSEYVLTVDFNNPVKSRDDLMALALSVEANSPIAKAFECVDNVGEGVYFIGDYMGQRLTLKVKGEKHGGKPKVRKPKTTLTDTELKAIKTLADDLTPVWRLNQGITETNATEIKHVGEVIKWVTGDILKEEEPAIIASGFEWKQFQSYIVQEIKDYYFDSIQPK